MIGYRHCDSRFPFLWSDSSQPAARWHDVGEAPAYYFADTPVGAWAEFIRHEGITDVDDLRGVRRALWAVELPDNGYQAPTLADDVVCGDLSSYPACRAEASRLRRQGATQLVAPSAALLPGGATGWVCAPILQTSATPRDGRVIVLFGPRPAATGWPIVDAGAPSPLVCPLVRHL